jgi:acyl carrier protein
LPPGFEGQLAISGDGVALGYLNRAGLTAEKFVTIATRDGNLRCYLTGDIAIIGENGIVTFKGRRDRQVKIDGKRIELDEIEIALRRDPNLADAIVTCHGEPSGAKRIVAYLRPRNPARLSDPDFGREAMVALRAALPAWMIPSCAVVMNEYPLNPAGKVDRAKLAPPPAETPALPMAASGASPTETMLVRLWTDVLGPQASGTDRNFFDLGGTSLQLMRVHAGLEAELGRVIDVVALFKHTTIRDLARFLDGKIAGPSRAALAAQRAALQHRNMAHIRRSTT